MEYLKAWIWKEEARVKNGEEVDETLLKYVKKMHLNLTDLVTTKMVKRSGSGNFVMAELSDMQSENRLLKNRISELEKEIESIEENNEFERNTKC